MSKHLFSGRVLSGPLSKFKDKLHVYLQADSPLERSGDKLYGRVTPIKESPRHVFLRNLKDELRKIQRIGLEQRKEINGKVSSPTGNRKDCSQNMCSKSRYVDLLIFNKDRYKREDINTVPRKDISGKVSSSVSSGNKRSQDVSSNLQAKHVDLLIFNKDRYKHEDIITEPRKEIDRVPLSFPTRNGNEPFSHVLSRHVSPRKVNLRKLNENCLEYTDLESREEIDGKSSSSFISREKEPSQYGLSGYETPKHIHLRELMKNGHKYQETITEFRKASELDSDENISPTSSTTRRRNDFFSHGVSEYESRSHALLRKFKDELLKMKIELNKQQVTVTQPNKEMDRTLSSPPTKSENEHSGIESSGYVHSISFQDKTTDLEPRKEMNGKPSSSSIISRSKPSRDGFSKHEIAKYVELPVFNKEHHKARDTITEPREEIDKIPSRSISTVNEPSRHVLSTHKSRGYIALCKSKNKLCEYYDTDLETQEEFYGKSFSSLTRSRRKLQDVIPRHQTPKVVNFRKLKNDGHKYNDTITDLRKGIDLITSSLLTRSENESSGYGLSRHASPTHVLLCKYVDDLRNYLDNALNIREEIDRKSCTTTTRENEFSRHASSSNIISSHELLHKKMDKTPTNSAAKHNARTISRFATAKELNMLSPEESRELKDDLDTIRQPRKQIDRTLSSSKRTRNEPFRRLLPRHETPISLPSRSTLSLKFKEKRYKYQGTATESRKNKAKTPSTSPAKITKDLSRRVIPENLLTGHISLRKCKKEVNKYDDTVTEPQKEMDKTPSSLTQSENEISRHESSIDVPLYEFKDVRRKFYDEDLDQQNKLYRTPCTSPISSKDEISKRDSHIHVPLSKYLDTVLEPQKEMYETPSSLPTRSENNISSDKSDRNEPLYKFKFDYLSKHKNPVPESQTPYSSLTRTSNILSRHVLSPTESHSNGTSQHVKSELHVNLDTVLKGTAEKPFSSRIKKDPCRRVLSRKLDIPLRNIPMHKWKDELFIYQNKVTQPRKEYHRTSCDSSEDSRRALSKPDPFRHALSRAPYSRKLKNEVHKYQSTVTQPRKKSTSTSSRSPTSGSNKSGKARHVPIEIKHCKSNGVVSKTASDTTTVLDDGNIKVNDEQEDNKG